MYKSLFLYIAVSFSLGLSAQENPDSLYRDILSNRGKGNLSIILVDKCIAYERQKSPGNGARLSELFFYRGELLENENRLEEAVAAFTRSLENQGEKWVSGAAHYHRGCVCELLGRTRSRKETEETLVSSQLFWFGKRFKAESIPREFADAERDYREAGSPQANERLLQLYLVIGKVAEAQVLFNRLEPETLRSDDAAASRARAYEIMLAEAREDFSGAKTLESALPPQWKAQTENFLNGIRSRRLVRSVRFDWVDRTTQGTSLNLTRVQSDAETGPYSKFDVDFSMKRLMFEGAKGGFLLSGKADAGALIRRDRPGAWADVDVLGTFLNKNLSLPGGGISFGFKSFAGSGQRWMQVDGEDVSEKSESRLDLHLNGGIRHKLFVFASSNNRDVWLNDLSPHVTVSGEMFNALGIEAVESRKTDGVYGMGFAGSGWWPEKSNIHSLEKSIGFNTNLNEHFTLGAARLWMTPELTDQDELTVNHQTYTYAHRVTFSERISLIRLNGEIRFGILGRQILLGGHHTLERSSQTVVNDRSAQVARSAPDPSGNHPVLLSYYGERLNDEEIAYLKNATGYLPSASRFYLKVKWPRYALSAEYVVNGLRSKNREIRFSLSVTPRDPFMTQCLHNLALWR
jgi:tetratricopeptide (TPR) repeat protein